MNITNNEQTHPMVTEIDQLRFFCGVRFLCGVSEEQQAFFDVCSKRRSIIIVIEIRVCSKRRSISQRLNCSFSPLTFTKVQFWPIRKKTTKRPPKFCICSSFDPQSQKNNMWHLT